MNIALASPAHASPALAAPETMGVGIIIPDIITGGILALAIAAALLALALLERTRARERVLYDKYLIASRAAAQREQALMAQGATLYIWPLETEIPAVHGPEPELLKRCLDGVDAAPLALALNALRDQGDSFTLEVQDADGIAFRVLGRIVGREPTVVVWPVKDEPSRPVARRDDLEAIVEALPMATALRDWQGRLRYANPAYFTALGLAPGSNIATTPSLIRDEVSLATRAAENASCLREKRYAVVGGQRRTFSVTATPAQGGALVTLADATELDDAQGRLQRHIDAHDETLDRLKTAVVIFGPDRRLVYFNHAYADLWQLDPRFLEEKPAEGEILERLRAQRRLPEHRDFPGWKRGRAELYNKTIEPIEEFWHLPDMKMLRVVVQPHPFGGLLYLFEDVTDHMTLEASFNSLISVQRSTLDHLEEGVALFGTDGRLKLCNPAFLSIWRLDADALAGEPHVERVAQLCAELAGGAAALLPLVAQATGACERQIASGAIQRMDGSVIAYTAVPLPDGATLLSFLDISDRAEAERNLIAHNQVLEEAGQLKSAFIAHVSYQLRTPLTTIDGFAQALASGIAGELPQRANEYLADMLTASSVLKGQIDNMVDLAAIDAGAMELVLAPVVVADLFAAARMMVQDRCDKVGIELRLVMENDPGIIVADQGRLKQVLFNILNNAVKFTPGGGTITFGADGKGETVRIFVSDTGPGMPPELQARAFERFSSFRVGQASKGAGLGLPLVESITKLHGGFATLVSTEGVGTTVTCFLPRQPRTNAKSPGEEPTPCADKDATVAAE